ncbi:MAG: family 10 glycosylhydrolase [Bacteroidales bacterium]|nr:family 10 glycosylhydrolase [Bacteroidales bacterium]
MKKLIFLLLLLTVLPVSAKKQPTNPTQPKREFRGAWIQCVNGQYIGKSMQQIRTMLSTQLDQLQQCGINAILFQVRAECDALYRSSYEPWSRYLTGRQGLAPDDGWDPLAWMVDECHKREMECHAWINPYRAKTKGTTEMVPGHVAIRHKERVFQYDGLYILNPALPENRMYTCMIVEDILQRYDVDGIHMDDYFYPYPVAGQPLLDQIYFDADPRGFHDIRDWRRDNVSLLIQDLHRLIHDVKPWVKFGISPFGIYHNDPHHRNTAQGSATNGLQNYDDLYADVRLWAERGWVDYLIPQIYWNIGNRAADYGVLLHWWNDYCGQRPLFIGQDVERTVKEADPNNPNQHQMLIKYDLQRSLPHVQGSCQWYAAAVCNNPGNYRTVLQTRYHRFPALQPLMPFIDKKAPKKPLHVSSMTLGRNIRLTWDAPKAKKEQDRAVQYVVYDFQPKEKIRLDNPANILCITRSTRVDLPAQLKGHTIVVTALDRLHNESKGVKLKLK